MAAEDARAVATVDVSALYRAHRLGLTRLAVLLVDDLPTAEDVVQDAFANLYRRQSRIRQPDAALGYLRTTVVNGARSTLRRRRTVRRNVWPEAPLAPAAELLAQIAEEHRAVLAAVRTLPRRQREVLVLRYWLDLSEADIAETLGISRGTVKSQASRALDKLETILRTDDD